MVLGDLRLRARLPDEALGLFHQAPLFLERDGKTVATASDPVSMRGIYDTTGFRSVKRCTLSYG